MNARFFICATMVMAQVIGSMFGFGMVSVNELFSIPATHAAEGIAHTINYQGKLMDSSGGIVSDGNYGMKFSIYDSASGGSQLWTASSTLGIPTGTPENVSVAVENGLFSLLLGDTSSDQVAFPDDLFNKDELYLGVTIGSDSEMTPRKRLSAVPYAYNSEMLQGQHASGTVDGSLGGDLFALNQNSDTPASATRTALGIYTSGTSDTYDYLIRGNSGSDVFTVTRAGNVSTTGNLQVDGATIVGSATTTAVTFNGYVSSDFNPYSDLTYNLGSSAYRWLGLNVANVTSTNVTTTNLAASYVTTSELWVDGTQITGAGSTSNLQQVTDQGATTTNWVQFAGATSTDNLVPGTTLSYDLGSSAYRWNDLWVSSTYIGDATWNLREDANNYFTIADVGGSERVTVDTSGNVGINNASPAAKLDVVSSDFPVGKFTRQTTATNVPNSGYLLHTQSSGNMSDGFGGGIVFSLQDDTSAEENIATLYAVRDGADDSGALEFHTYLNGSRNERMVIDSAGYIGINATNPATRLQVGSESSSASEGIRIQSDADAYMELIADDNNSGEDNNPYIYFSQDGASITGIMGVTGVDNEAPNGSSYTGVLDNSMLIGHSYSEGLLQFGTNNSVKMTIDQGGNVGIGTTNPSSFKLQVAGNVGPETNNTYDLGSPALSWRNLYVSGTTAFNNVVYTWSPTQGAVDTYLKNDGSGNLTWETISGVSTPSWQEVTDVGATTTHWIQFAGATTTGDFVPTSTLSLDLGTADNRWDDIWGRELHLGTSTWDLYQAIDQSFTINNSDNVNTDEFDNASIESYWTTSTPAGTITESGDVLNINCSGSCDWYTGTTEDSPIIYQPLSNGDFTVTTYISDITAGSNNNAGIILYTDRDNSINWVLRQGSAIYAWHLFNDSTSGGPSATVSSVTDAPVWLRVQRKYTTIYFQYSTDGNNFITAGSYTQPFEPANVGLLGKTWSSSSIDVDFEYFELNENIQVKVTNSGHILPGTNNSQNIGAHGYSWNNVYSSGTIYGGDLNIEKPINTQLSGYASTTGTTVRLGQVAGDNASIY